MEKAYKLVKENGYSPLKACKVANVRIEDYNKYIEELNGKYLFTTENTTKNGTPASFSRTSLKDAFIQLKSDINLSSKQKVKVEPKKEAKAKTKKKK